MAKKVANKKNQIQKKSNDGWVIAIIAIFAVTIIAMLVFSRLGPTLGAKTPTATPASVTTYSNTDGLSMGDPNAKVQVIEFADYQCPYCQLYTQQIEPGIISKYVDTGLVYYTINPLAFLGQESIDAALAGYCASDQGKFWEYRSVMFANLTGENVGSYTQDNLIAFAQSLGLDTTTFTTCLTSAQHQQDLTDAETVATNAGVNSTPSFLVNGQVVDSSGLEAAIEAALGN
jgi:protein-disulfide isomerase